jgi:streptomycin 6-kinase
MFEIDPRVRENVIAWGGAAGRRWLASLPQLVADLTRRWELSGFGPVLPGGSHSWVAPVRSLHGEGVLKIPLIDEENRLEAQALGLYRGEGAVRLLEFDSGSGAMLLERCTPGLPLSNHPDRDAAVETACGLLRRLWREPPPDHRFILVTDKAADWEAELSERLDNNGLDPRLRRLVRTAADAAGWFAREPARSVLVNRDAHLGNFLTARREPWLLIDPKPLVGDPAFDAGYLVGDLAGASPSPEQVEGIVVQLASELGVDSGRIRGWALVRAVDNIFWYLERGGHAGPTVALAEALL